MPNEYIGKCYIKYRAGSSKYFKLYHITGEKSAIIITNYQHNRVIIDTKAIWKGDVYPSCDSEVSFEFFEEILQNTIKQMEREILKMDIDL